MKRPTHPHMLKNHRLLFTFFLFIALTCAGACGRSKDDSPQKTSDAPNTGAGPTAPVPAADAAPKSNTPVDSETTADKAPPPPEGMRLVNGGAFTMGLDHPRAIADEMAEHEVTVKSFYLDTTEVTNQAYQTCVDANICRPPRDIDTQKSGFEPLRLFRTPQRPVTGVSRHDAITYCEWMGKRLPTEAEFERAARGDDGRMYAWGNASPKADLAVYAGKVTKDVGSCPKGVGPYGHLDLAGNVWEWTADLYDPYAYTRPTANTGVPADCDTIKQTQDELRKQGKQGFTGTNPIPEECDHVLRGGAFNYFAWGLRASNRVHHPESWRLIMAGFRCAKDIP
ncbi:MAG: SUMF1/EgtB/PvdO family nonheme iron enzyme, partial [Deltaproteobacteria bacterium]|nr:SUMF1/EgtB/PvdO family nonheme iron enzyme [Deltaproteobacteria bacterium]